MIGKRRKKSLIVQSHKTIERREAQELHVISYIVSRQKLSSAVTAILQ